MEDLFIQIKNSSILDNVSILNQIEEWRKVRNQLVHALMNKKIVNIEEETQKCAKEAYDLSRKVDLFLVKPFKKKYN